MTPRSTVCLCVSLTVRYQRVHVFAQGRETGVCSLNHMGTSESLPVLHYRSSMELRKPGRQNILQLRSFLVSPTPQLHRNSGREKLCLGVCRFWRADRDDTCRVENREGSLVRPGAVIAGTETGFCSRRAARTGKAAANFHLQLVAGEGRNQHTVFHTTPRSGALL